MYMDSPMHIHIGQSHTHVGQTVPYEYGTVI